MPVFDLFSRRKKQREGTKNSDPYKYEDLPKTFRVQVGYILNAAIGCYVVDHYGGNGSPSNTTWEFIDKTMRKELGRIQLDDHASDPKQACLNFILTEHDTDNLLDIIELSFGVVDKVVRKVDPWEGNKAGIEQDADDAIAELNERFNQHCIGYRYENGRIVQIDSEYVHSETVKPALTLLHTEGFYGASDEFMKAHEHYRKGRTKEAIAEALKAFESTLKSICTARSWPYPPEATAKSLIEIMFTQGLLPPELTSHFTGLRTTLESGLPTVRNRQGGHGQGADKRPVAPYVAAYALHLAATNIVFLVEAHKAR